MVALHLTSPLLLLALAVLRGRRRVGGLVVTQILLMAGGILLLGTQPAGRTGAEPLLAGVLAVGSAAAVAGLITAVTKVAPTINPDIAAATQLAIAAVATIPFILVAAAPDQADAAYLLAAGAVFLGPGFAIYWRALRGVSAATAGIIGLDEAIAATLFGVALFGDRVSLISALSGALVLAAIALELLRPKIEKPTSPARLGDEL
ncbi:MAG: EamA family transporter [Pseudonocardiaceae bacterium]